MPECNICGGTSFSAAPNNRLSRKRQPPLCTKCGSLERQRVGRELASAIRIRDKFKSYALLDVGKDATIPKAWFASSKVTEPDDTSIDLLGGERDKFDFIVCSHVIQKLRDPRRAVQRLVGSLSNDGILLLNYPSPVTRSVTEEFSSTRRMSGPRFIFGRDFEREYRTLATDAHVVAVEGDDPVTKDKDIMYFLTKSPSWATRMVKNLDARLVQ
jgi:SAM-dependent methyltransferase